MKAISLFALVISFGCASSAPSSVRSERAPSVVEERPIDRTWNEAFLARSEDTYLRVTEDFAAHLRAHPDDREARNRYGKLLYAQGRWRDAALTFEAAIHGNDHVSQGAARNAILAWRRVLDQGDAAEGWFRPLADEEDVDRVALQFFWDRVVFETLERAKYRENEMSEVEQRMADAADRYVAIADPLDEALPNIQLISANSYFRHHRFDEAADRCLRIVERWSRHEMANTCGKIILNMFSATDDLEKLEHHARALWRNNGAMACHAELKANVEETLHYVAFQNAWLLVEEANRKRGAEKKELLLRAAERFQRYQDEFPSSPHADKALFNALAQYVTFGVKENARSVARRIVEGYPTSPVAREARQVLATLAQ